MLNPADSKDPNDRMPDFTEAPELSVVIPVFNEAAAVDGVFDELTAVLNDLGKTYEIIFVDDGSTDGTSDRLEKIAGQSVNMEAVHLRRNFGQTAALMAGFDVSTGAIIITLDGDGQNDPADIPGLLAKLDQGFDVVSGWRKKRRDGFLRSFLSRVANRLISRISGVQLRDYGCTLKAYRRSVLEDVRLYGEMHRFIPIYTSWQGARVTEIPVNHRRREAGQSKYGLGRTWKVVLDLMLVMFLERAATQPMHLFGGVGLLALLAATLIATYTVWIKIANGVSFVSTPLPLLVVLLTVLGIMSLLIGLVAEMILRTYYESQDKKPYAIKQSSKSPTDD
jgi:glycosyltransferase involved in cell wall biosynthesis